MTDEQKSRIRQWVEALRSDKYKQAQKRLRIVNNKITTYCCLGVATELCAKGLGTTFEAIANVIGEDHDEVLSNIVRDWFGLPTNNPRVQFETPVWDGDVDGSQLGAANDRGYTFAQIADAIERTYLNG